MAKKFFSFLGRGSFNKESNTYGYSPCVYSFNGRNSKKTEFVQDAIAQIVLSEFSSDDKICIFVTPTVREENWVKLEPILKSMYGEMVEPVFINDFKNKEDIWNLFQSLYEHIEEDDDIYLDITHSFRYLPMLYLTVLNYAQYLKNITVSGIFYGAFEAQYEENSEKIAPIFDLTDMFETMQWANAADLFSNYGIAERIKFLASKKNKEDPALANLSQSIVDVSNNLNYARGKQINLGDMFDICQRRIDDYKNSSGVRHNPALLPILDKVSYKIEGFDISSNNLNFLPAVEWYVNHNMPAEAISMMREGVITYLLEEEGLDHKNLYLRDLLGRRLSYKGQSFLYNNNSDKSNIERIIRSPIAEGLKNSIERFNTFRNDIDHCGFGDNAKSPKKILDEIKRSFKDMQKVFAEYGNIELC